MNLKVNSECSAYVNVSVKAIREITEEWDWYSQSLKSCIFLSQKFSQYINDNYYFSNMTRIYNSQVNINNLLGCSSPWASPGYIGHFVPDLNLQEHRAGIIVTVSGQGISKGQLPVIVVINIIITVFLSSSKKLDCWQKVLILWVLNLAPPPVSRLNY